MTWNGSLGTPSKALETWTIGLNFDVGLIDQPLGGGGPPGAANLLLTAWGNRLKDLATDQVQCQYVKVAYIGGDGKYVGDPALSTGAALTGTDTSAAHYLPFQVALTCSLMTGHRGASKRGRIYLPGVSAAIDRDGLISAAAATQYATAVSTFLRDARTAMGGRDAVIASTRGYQTAVTQVRVGRVLDTQRRRRRSLDEAYTGPVDIPA